MNTEPHAHSNSTDEHGMWYRGLIKHVLIDTFLWYQNLLLLTLYTNHSPSLFMALSTLYQQVGAYTYTYCSEKRLSLPRGWRGIRTPGIPINTSVFKTDSFNRSDIHPCARPPYLSARWQVGATLCDSLRLLAPHPVSWLYCLAHFSGSTNRYASLLSIW